MKTYTKPAILSTRNGTRCIKGSVNKNSNIASDNNDMTFTATAPAYEADE